VDPSERQARQAVYPSKEVAKKEAADAAPWRPVLARRTIA